MSKVKQAELKQGSGESGKFSLAQKKTDSGNSIAIRRGQHGVERIGRFETIWGAGGGSSEADHTSLSKRRSYGAGSGGLTNDFCHGKLRVPGWRIALSRGAGKFANSNRCIDESMKIKSLYGTQKFFRHAAMAAGIAVVFGFGVGLRQGRKGEREPGK